MSKMDSFAIVIKGMMQSSSVQLFVGVLATPLSKVKFRKQVTYFNQEHFILKYGSGNL